MVSVELSLKRLNLARQYLLSHWLTKSILLTKLDYRYCCLGRTYRRIWVWCYLFQSQDGRIAEFCDLDPLLPCKCPEKRGLIYILGASSGQIGSIWTVEVSFYVNLQAIVFHREIIRRSGYFQQAFKAHLSSIKKRRFLCRGKNWFRCYSWDRWGNKIELLGARVLVMNVVPELKPWHKQSRIADLETDILFVNCSTRGGSTLCPVDPVRMCAWYGWWEENTLVGQISAVILYLNCSHIWLLVVWMR